MVGAVAGSSSQGPAGGVPGGQGGGVPGGVIGGQVGGSLEGSASAVVAPRFDAAYLQNPEPAYPPLSKRFGEEGKVILRVLVNPEGQPEQVEVRQSSGHTRLDQAALGTVKRWRFTPARRGAERLAAWVLVPLSFQLDA
ncbi:MAG: energy transducer TonB [Acidobacteria bacterium]|nr:energy transducer TonB [Acidobacteriota bacterium]MBI3488548.1 energy transducer TonB [Acidobacteriota bacterium]